MDPNMLKMWQANPSVNPLTGRKIKPNGAVYKTLQTLATKATTTNPNVAGPSAPGPSVPRPSSKDSMLNAWAKKFAEIWFEYSVDTDADIIFEPIPKNIDAIFNLNAKQKKMVEDAKAFKEQSLTITVAEELGHIQVSLNEDDGQTIAMMYPSKEQVPRFHHNDKKDLEALARKFVQNVKQIVDSNSDLKKIRLEAIPSYRAAGDFGKSVLKDEYGKFLVELGVNPKIIRVTEFYYDDEGDLTKKTIPFRVPVAKSK